MINNQAKLISTSLLVVSLLILAWTLYGTIQRVRFHGSLDSTQQKQAAAPVRKAVTRYNVKQIVNAHLFGRAQIDSSASVVSRAPETKLRLALLGVVASDNPSLARAVIGVNAKNGKNYSVGEKIAGTDAKLHAVEKSRVILNRSGKFESLQMVRKALDDKKQPKMARAPITVSSSTRATRNSPVPDAPSKPQNKKFPF